MYFYLFISQLIFAQTNISEEVIDSLEPISEQKEVHSTIQLKKSRFKPEKTSSKVIQGNLEPLLVRRSTVEDFRTPTQIPKNQDFAKESKLQIGTSLKALINSNIIAYANSESPIQATVLEGAFQGSILIGNATMDPQTKRVGVSFTKLRKKGGTGIFDISGVVRDRSGDLGLDGKHESFYWHYFWSETILNAASGFADASTQRSQQTNGGYIVVPSMDSSLKQGVATGFSRSADRIGERIRSLPEYVTAKGPFIVNVLILN